MRRVVRLAAAGRADEDDEFPIGDVQIDGIDGSERRRDRFC